jgi:CpcD/allophycocyanin linker domain
MYGTATTSTRGSNESNSRQVLVEVAGAFHRQVHNSNHIIKVPFNRLSQTIQRIARTGGKILNVTMSSLDISDNKVSTVAEALPVQANTTVSLPIETTVSAVQELPSVEATVDKETTAKAVAGKTRSFGKKTAEKAPKNTKRAKKPRG